MGIGDLDFLSSRLLNIGLLTRLKIFQAVPYLAVLYVQLSLR